MKIRFCNIDDIFGAIKYERTKAFEIIVELNVSKFNEIIIQIANKKSPHMINNCNLYASRS